MESSAVYQGIARGMGIDLVYKVNQFAIGDTMPDLTIMIDLDAEAGISRKKKQAELDRMESETIDFHKKVVEDTDNLRACIQIESILLTEV